MAYTSPEEIKKVMRKLPTSVTTEDIQFHIDKAEALLDGYLGEVFETPFEPVPKLIKNLAIDLSVFYLAESLYTSNMPNLDESYQQRYDRSMKLLDQIIIGDISIGVSRKSSQQDAGYATTNDEQIFSYDEPEW